jgi:RHS repeat-associated protein
MSRGYPLRHLAALSAALVLASFAAPPVSAAGNAGILLHKTVDPAQLSINPNIGVTLAVDKTTAIPADTLTYTAVVTNPTATFAMGGDINAEAHADADATVAYYWDELEVCALGCGNGGGNPNWKPVATFVATQPGYQPVDAPALSTGMSLSVQPVTRNGVVYPTTGDLVLGTVISPSATAAWTYLARVTLTPTQIGMLSDPAQALAVRNVIHMEVTVRNVAAAQPWTDRELFMNPFTTTSNPGAIANVTVTFTLPDGTTTQVPATSSLAPGASAIATTQYKVPVPGARGATETEPAYIARLHSLDGSALTASAVAAGSGFSGPVYATSSPVTTNEFVPIVLIAKSGPASIPAGDTETNPLALQNIGGATASLAITDTVPSSPNGTVSGTPASLEPNATGSATATYPVPISQAEGSLTDTASVTWQDVNGNSYGPLSSAFTTTVHNVLFGADLSLAPVTAGPNPPDTSQTLTATLIDRHTNPIPNQVVTFTITGANPGTGTATTDASGKAVFTYTGTNPGNDTAIATVVASAITLTSNTSSISWGKPLQPVVTTQVQGNFFPNPNNNCTFGASGTPAFGQTFPDILFNADHSLVPNDISNIGPATRPFTDKTVDVNGNYNGQIVAQGNGLQAGNAPLDNFFAAFTGSFIVSQAGDLTFSIIHDDGYILGVGNGATRVSGDLEGSPPAVTPFNGYGVVAAFNQGGTFFGSATIHFPAPGTYPYELDYTECNGGGLQLVLETAKFIPQTNPLSIYVGYADGLRAGGSIFPFPWNGSPNVIFFPGGGSDDGAMRFDNSGTDPITFDQVTVDVGPFHYDIWPRGVTIGPGQILILTGTAGDNFDTSDTPITCNQTGYTPAIHVTVGGVVTTFTDTGQVLNTGGIDAAVCGLGNESHAWTRIAGQAIAVNVPLPPAVMLDLMPFNIPNAVQGQTVSVTVSALDSAGNPQVNLPVTLQVFGVNAQNLSANTNAAGLATFSYPGNLAGTDLLQASAFIAGLRALSNQGTVVWSPPGGTNNPLGATITNTSPADGTVVTKPVPVDATITPPSGQSITSWRVFYQAQDPGSPVTIASGNGTPPSPLATFDPTRLPNDTYAITVAATSSNGAVQQLSTTVAVMGDLKPGRYVTDYQDMSVPVGGFQMEVRRSYDSIDKSSGDFGTGWKVSVANFRTAPNRVLGAGGWTQYNKSCTLGLCFTAFKNSAPRYVAVTFPDQHTEVFDFTPQGGTNIFWACTPKFTARASIGTTSTLQAIDDTGCSYLGDGNIYAGTGLYSPKQFKLTLRDGRSLVLDVQSGLVSESDTSGNSLTVSPSGVHSILGPAASPTQGPSITFTRDAEGRITDVSGPVAGQHLHYSYFAPGGPNELQTYTDAAGHMSTYSYDATSGNLVLSSDSNNQPLETLHYDSNGRLVSIANGSASPITITTSADLHQQVFLSPSGRLTTVLTLDDLGDVVEQDLAFGGQPALKTTFTYDGAGRLTSVTDPLNHTTSATYDESSTSANGEMLTSTDAAHRTYTFQNYTTMGQPGTVLKPDGSVLITYTYDPTTGALVSEQRPGENPTVYQYYPSGLPQSITDPGGRMEEYTYDSNGHLRTAGDNQNRSLTFNVDAAGNVTSLTDEVGNPTFYQYNGDGSLALLTDGDHNTWQFLYDLQGRMKEIKDPFGKSTINQYNSLGQLSRHTDRNGAVTDFSYDVDGNLTQIARPNNDMTNFSYDPVSQLIEADNAASHIDRSYDAAGNLTTESTCANTGSPLTLCSAAASAGQPSVTLSYSWTPDGQLQSVGSTDAGSIQYTYDALGRLSGIIDPAHATTSFGYDNLNRITSINRPNGISDQVAYNASGNVVSRDSFLNGTLIVRADYAVDPITGRRTSSTDTTGTTNYTYFDNGTLRSATRPAGSTIPNESYTYDAAGNRTSAGGVASTFTGDRLQTDGQFNYAYDANGQLISKTPVGGGTGTTYGWDAAGQLTSITYPNATSSSYRYDAFGRRVASVDPNGETRYVWNGSSVHADYSGQNNLEASYVSGASFGAALEQTSGTQTLYYLADGLNNPTAQTNSAGQVVGTYAFNSFGVPQAGNAASNRYSFGGYQLDSASGLYYAGARYYDSSSGRFLSTDPQPAVNPYPYAKNDPVDLVDPLGQQAFREYVAILQRVALEAITLLVRIGCGLLNLLALVGLIQFATDAIGSNALGRAGELWTKLASPGSGGPQKILGGARIPDRTFRIPGIGDIFLEAKNAAEIDGRSVAQIKDFVTAGRVILLTRLSLETLPRDLQLLAKAGLLKWVKCFG